MESEEIIGQLESLLKQPHLTSEQRSALEQVLKDYRPGLTNEQIIRIIEFMISVLLMTQ